MTAAELRALLEPYGIRALKSRSQHFLLDERVTEAMADAAGIGADSRVLEIGPGPGVLTKTLLDRGAEVIAVELDRRFSALLHERFSGEKFKLIESDILALSTHEIVSRFSSTTNDALGDSLRERSRGRDSATHSDARVRTAFEKRIPVAASFAVIANLPYSITSATLQKFLFEQPRPATITLMIQKEVADRVLARPNDMSALAVMVQTLARARRVRDVSAGAFLPPPKVDSAVIHMEVKSEAEVREFFVTVPRDRYFAVVKQAFAERRKQLKNTLRAVQPDAARLESALIGAKIKPSARPEELTVEDWIRLCRCLEI